MTDAFHALEWYEIKGRGRACSVDWGKTAGEARALTGRVVKIDGETLQICGVETHAVFDPHVEQIIGLLVREPK